MSVAYDTYLKPVQPGFYRSDPIIAIDKEYFPEEPIGGNVGNFWIRGQSAVRADGVSRAKVEVFLADEKGVPVPDAVITLTSNKPGKAVIYSTTDPIKTDLSGKAYAWITCSEKGTVEVTASYGNRTAGPARILFIPEVIPLLTEKGGILTAEVDSSFLSNGSSPYREGVVISIRMNVLPEGETTRRPLDFAIVGLAERVLVLT